MNRAVSIHFSKITAKKREFIRVLISEFSIAVRFYLNKIYETKNYKINNEILTSCNITRLSKRYLTQAYIQAVNISNAYIASKTTDKSRVPYFSGKSIQIDSKTAKFEKPGVSVLEKKRGKTSAKYFDNWIRISSFKPGKLVSIPINLTKIFKKWSGCDGSERARTITLHPNRIVFSFNIPEKPLKQIKLVDENTILGIDLGINKLITRSDGAIHGEKFKEILNKISQRRPGSKRYLAAQQHKKCYAGWTINRLPWDRYEVISIENLKTLHKGVLQNKHRSNKKTRGMVGQWACRQVGRRIAEKAREHRVRLVEIDPAYTSQQCPKCKMVDRKNRNGESFKCIRCTYSADADYVGACNIRDAAIMILSGAVGKDSIFPHRVPKPQKRDQTVVCYD